jgi:hypothetical protein
MEKFPKGVKTSFFAFLLAGVHGVLLSPGDKLWQE